MASETMAISCRISRGKMTRDPKSVLQNRQQITRTFKELRHNTRPQAWSGYWKTVRDGEIRQNRSTVG